MQELDDLLRAALKLASHVFDRAEDPGWQQELDQELFDQAVVAYIKVKQKGEEDA